MKRLRSPLVAAAVLLAVVSPAMGHQFYFEDFTDGVLGDDNLNGGTYVPGYGSGASFITTNPGRSVPTVYGANDILNDTSDGVHGYGWDAPSAGLSFDPANQVLFTRRVVLTDYYFAGEGEPILFNMDLDGEDASGGRTFYFATGIPQEVGTKLRGAVWDFDGAFQGDVAVNQTFTYDPADIAGDPQAIDDVLTSLHEYTVLFREGDASGVTVETYAGVDGAKEFVALPAMAKLNNIRPTPDSSQFNQASPQPASVYSSISADNGNNVQIGDVSLEVGVTDPTDFNLDYFTDASDLNIWNDNKFTSNTVMQQGDANNDGVTDASDLNLWNDNKFTAASGSQPTAVNASLTATNSSSEVAQIVYNPGTGKLNLVVLTDQVEASIIIETAESNIVDTDNELPLYLGSVELWGYTYFNGKMQYSDGAVLVPVTPGEYLLGTLLTGLDASAFGEVEYGSSVGTQFTTVTIIPEPASLAILGISGLLLVQRRRAA